jgi:hypothetical protein
MRAQLIMESLETDIEVAPEEEAEDETSSADNSQASERGPTRIKSRRQRKTMMRTTGTL